VRGIARSWVIAASGASWIVACGDLQQAGTGSGGGTDDGSGDTGSAVASSTGDSPGDGEGEGEGEGTGTGATSAPGTGTPDDGSTSAGLDDTGSESGTDEGGSSTGDGPLVGPHDGVYEGTIMAQYQVSGEVGSCTGPVTLTVNEAAIPQVSGMSSCSVTIDGYTADIVSTIEGSLAAALATGTMSANINGTPESTTWNGNFAVDTMGSNFMGDFPQGPYTVTYMGTWSAMR
jgi:hypothetical protein